MCPACLTTVALTVAATASGSALTVFVTKTLGLPLPRAARADAPKRNGSIDAVVEHFGLEERP
ncbi:MAG TPA: hypothetical protein VFG38_08230 [Pseudomonadales bacterium]|nr:hypothetical protein [Pseudomonadales bacterium]